MNKLECLLILDSSLDQVEEKIGVPPYLESSLDQVEEKIGVPPYFRFLS